MNKKSIIIQIIGLLAIVLFSGTTMAQSKAKVENVDFNLENENLIITYDIVKSKASQTFNVSVTITTTKGKKIPANALSGDIGPGVHGGDGKKIIWDLNKDNVYIDDEIVVEVFIEPETATVQNKTKTGETVKRVSVGGALWRSLIFPGWGNHAAKGRGAQWLLGVAGYGCVGSAIYFNNKSYNTYEDYLNSDDYEERNSLYDDAEAYYNNQKIFMLTAATIWVADLIWTGFQAGHINKKARASKVDMGMLYDPIPRKPMLTLTYHF
jgi:hypothetical protein